MSAKTPQPKNREAPSHPALRDGELILIGRVGRAYGLKGAFYVSGRDEAVPKSYRELLIGASVASVRPATLLSTGISGDRPFITCTLSPDRTAAEQLTGQWIYAARAQVSATVGRPRQQPAGPQPAAGTVVASAAAPDGQERAAPVASAPKPASGRIGLIWSDLEGVPVVDNAGLPLGHGVHVYNSGASDVLIVRASDGRQVDIPLVPDYVDLDQTVPPTGLPVLALLVEAAYFADLWQE